MLTREQIESWREWYWSEPYREGSGNTGNPEAEFNVLCDMAIRALSAAPNNAGEQKPVHSAITTSERPDRASGDSGTLSDEVEALVETLRSFGKAYPETVFLPLTEHEREEYATTITRASAEMGRHCAKFMAEAADMIERLANGNAVAGESPDARDAKTEKP